MSSKKLSAAAGHAIFGGAFGRPGEIYLQKVVGWRWGKSTGGWEWNDATSKRLRHYFVDQDFAFFHDAALRRMYVHDQHFQTLNIFYGIIHSKISEVRSHQMQCRIVSLLSG